MSTLATKLATRWRFSYKFWWSKNELTDDGATAEVSIKE